MPRCLAMSNCAWGLLRTLFAFQWVSRMSPTSSLILMAPSPAKQACHGHIGLGFGRTTPSKRIDSHWHLSWAEHVPHLLLVTRGASATHAKMSPKGRTSRAQANEAVRKSRCRDGPCGRPRANHPAPAEPYDATAKLDSFIASTAWVRESVFFLPASPERAK